MNSRKPGLRKKIWIAGDTGLKGILMFFWLFFGLSMAQAQEDSNDIKQESMAVTYDVEEGDRWQETLRHQAIVKGKFSFAKSGRGGGIDKKLIRIEITDRLETEVEVKNRSSERFEVDTEIEHFQFQISSPIWTGTYNSKDDSSGIYHRIFKHIVGEKIEVAFHRRGHRLSVRGLEDDLESARENLPDIGKSLFIKKLVSVFSSYLEKDFMLPMLCRGWQPIPEDVQAGGRWRRDDVITYLKLLGKSDIAETRSTTELQMGRREKNRIQLKMFPKVSIMYWKSTAEKRRGNEPAGTIVLSSTNGVEQFDYQVEMHGTEEDWAKIEVHYKRKRLD